MFIFNLSGRICLIVFLAVPLNLCESAQIVFYFATSPHGHRVGVWPLVSALAQKGHKITFISSFDSSTSPINSATVNEINVKPVIDGFGPLFYANKDSITFRKEGIAQTIWDVTALNTLFKCESILQSWRDLFGSILQIEDGIDLMIIDVPNNDCGFGLAYKFQAKKIALYSGQMGLFMSLPDSMGFVPETAWVPDMQLAYVGDNNGFSFFQRLSNTLRAARWHTFRDLYIIPQHNKLYQKYLADSADQDSSKIPSLADLEKKVTLVYSNSHFSEEYPKSLPPSVLTVGSMHISKTSLKVPQEIEQFIGGERFAYVSFGKEIRLPKEIEHILVQSLLDFGLKVIIQSQNSDEWKGNTKVFMKEWLPQQEVLSHRSIYLIISHGSSYAIQEAIYYRVPIVVMPVQLDQDYNAHLVEKLGIGVNLELSTLSKQQLKETLAHLKYPELKAAVDELSSFSKERPIHPLDSALWWTEFILRRKSSEMSKLQCESASRLNWVQRRLIDVWAFATIITLMFGLVVGMFLIWVAIRLATSNESIFSDDKIKVE